MQNIQRTYQASGDIHAQFEHVYAEPIRKKKRIEKGALWVKQDGRVRWSYTSPHLKDFVFDGKTAYFYEPEHAQVTVFEDFDKSDIGQISKLLWGQGNLKERFNVEDCNNQCPPSPNTVWALLLTPKKTTPQLKKAILWVNRDAWYVEKTTLFDPLNNTSEYIFNNFKKNEIIENKKFTFKAPAGVSVLKSAL